MFPFKVPPRERWPTRFRPAAAKLLVMAILAIHGIGRAAEAAATAVGQGAVVVAATGWLPTHARAPGDAVSIQGAASAPRAPRPDAPRLGGGDCCRTPTCRCGCLYALASIAIAALGDRQP